MKKTLIAGLGAAVLTLTACGGGTDEATSSSSTTPVTAATSATGAAPTADTSSAGTDGSAGAVTLDEQSTTWFATFCTGFTGLEDSFSSIESDLADATGTTVAEKQAAVAGVISDLGTQLKGVATEAGSVPPPTIENGTEMAAAAVDGFNQIGDAMIAAADEFAQAPVTDEATLKAAATQLQTSLQQTAGEAQTAFSAIDMKEQPGLEEAVSAIPECAALNS